MRPILADAIANHADDILKPAMFSNRTSWELGENPFAAKLRQARATGRELFNLTVSNPTQCGFHYDEAALLAPLHHPQALNYAPEPFGMAPARAAVALYYRDHGAVIPIENICLTTSTSEAYSFLFRLLCDPGDELLIARPSYPLFDFIARLDNVTLREYPLHHDPTTTAASTHAWHIDLDALRALITPRTRAILLVHPNNPTGHFTSAAEREVLEKICAQHHLALIVDEVFLDYALTTTPTSFTTQPSSVLTFTLSGLSKVCALPQMKASWIATTGPATLVADAMARLEVIADTFLSMNAPIQFALPHWLASRHALQQQILNRMRTNLTTLDVHLHSTTAQRLALEAGWTTILRVPRHINAVPFAEAALAHGVITQPGSFYGLPEGRIVLSLLTPTETWQQGLDRLPLNSQTL